MLASVQRLLHSRLHSECYSLSAQVCRFALKGSRGVLGSTVGLKGWSNRPWGELIFTVAEQFAFGLFATCGFKDRIQHPRTGLFDRFVFEDRSHVEVHVVVHAFEQR